jgi:hypothetical protein
MCRSKSSSSLTTLPLVPAADAPTDVEPPKVGHIPIKSNPCALGASAPPPGWFLLEESPGPATVVMLVSINEFRIHESCTVMSTRLVPLNVPSGRNVDLFAKVAMCLDLSARDIRIKP